MKAYDPAFAYETTVIVMDGLKRMYQDQEDWIYYITLTNDNYQMPAMPKGVEEGIVRGIYKFSSRDAGESKLQRAAFRQRRDPERSGPRPEDPGRASTAWPATSGA